MQTTTHYRDFFFHWIIIFWMNGCVLWLSSIFVHFWFILILYDSCNWSICCGTIWSQRAKNEKMLLCLSVTINIFWNFAFTLPEGRGPFIRKNLKKIKENSMTAIHKLHFFHILGYCVLMQVELNMMIIDLIWISYFLPLKSVINLI